MFAIDRLGLLKAQIKELESEVKKTQDRLLASMKEDGLTEVVGKSYKGSLISSTTLQTDAEALFRTINLERFLKVVKPSVTELRKELSSVELEKCTVEIPAADRFCVKLK